MTRYTLLAASTVALSLLASCATPPRPAPVVAPPAAPPPPAPAPADTDWRDLPLSPGGWSYGAASEGSSAKFGAAGAPALAIRCDKASRRVHFAPTAAPAGSVTLTIRTSYASRDLPLVAGKGGGVEASLPAADPFLDRIAFSRGRVSYAVPGRPLLMTPAWAEPARVIEDCRS